jgi:anthranilate phosphoribosyltransferase
MQGIVMQMIDDMVVQSCYLDLEVLLEERLSDQASCDVLRNLTLSTVTVECLAKVVAILSAHVDANASELFADIGPVFDCCGTGGSGISHFNVSTTVAFVLAAAQVLVVKFGNRAASSTSGSFDLLEALGIPVAPEPRLSAEIFNTYGLAFLYAPQFYPALAALSHVRKTVGVKTVLNLVGPLLNPAKPAYRLLGTPDALSQQLIASYLCLLKSNRRSFVVSSNVGMDEISPYGESTVQDVTPGNIETFTISGQYTDSVLQSSEYNPSCKLSVSDNVTIFNSILSGSREFEFFRQAVVLNAAAAFLLYGKADTMQDGETLANSLLDSLEVKHMFERFSERFKGAYANYTF